MKNYLKIDFEIFQDERLNTTDIILLSYFSSFEKCFTNNETIEKTFNLSIQQIQRSIKKLKRLNYIKVKNNKKHKRREIISTLYKESQKKNKKVVDEPKWMKKDRQSSESLSQEEEKQAQELAKKLLGN